MDKEQKISIRHYYYYYYFFYYYYYYYYFYAHSKISRRGSGNLRLSWFMAHETTDATTSQGEMECLSNETIR